MKRNLHIDDFCLSMSSDMCSRAVDESPRPPYISDGPRIPADILSEIFRTVLDLNTSGFATLRACRLVSRASSAIARSILFRNLKFTTVDDARTLHTLRAFLSANPHIARCVRDVQLFDNRHWWVYSHRAEIPYTCRVDPADVLAALQRLPRLRSVLFHNILPCRRIDWSRDLQLQRLPHLEAVHVRIPSFDDTALRAPTLVLNLLDIFASVGELRVSATELHACSYQDLRGVRQGPLALRVGALRLQDARPGFMHTLSLEPFVGSLSAIIADNTDTAAFNTTLLAAAVSLTHLTYLIDFDLNTARRREYRVYKSSTYSRSDLPLLG